MSEVSSHQAGTPAWVDLTTSDPAASRRFYGELFGWEFQVGPADTGHYTTCLVRGHSVAGIAGDPAPAGTSAAWTTYLASGDVDDADAAAASAGPLGGSVLFPPQDSPFGRFAVLRDPQGATFNAIRLPSAPEGPAS